MSETNKQKIDGITESTINQANGDIVITAVNGVSAVEVVQICNDVMRTQMSIYTQQAIMSAQERLDYFCDKFTARLATVEDKVSKQLKEPSIQIALHESIRGSIDGDNDELTDELIDLMIERMSITERCSKQFIIDTARQILPKLTPSHIAILALKVFNNLKLGCNSDELKEILFNRLDKLLANCSIISDLDIEYLNQVGCFGNPKMLINQSSVESRLLSAYDLFFRKNCDNAKLNKIISTHSYSSAVIIWVFSILNLKNDELSFKVTRSDIIEPQIEKRNDGTKDFYQNVKDLLTPLSENETKDYLTSNNPNWFKAIETLTNCNSVFLSPLGTYLGTRALSKHIGIDIPLNIFY